MDFKDLFISLNGQSYPTLAAAKAAAAPVIAYGQFLNTVINFLIIAFVIFMVVRQAKKLQRTKEEAPAAPTTKDCALLLHADPPGREALPPLHVAVGSCRDCSIDSER